MITLTIIFLTMLLVGVLTFGIRIVIFTLEALPLIVVVVGIIFLITLIIRLIK